VITPTEDERKAMRELMESLQTFYPFCAIRVWLCPRTRRVRHHIAVVHNAPRRIQ
jgi:hypothetical protein